MSKIALSGNASGTGTLTIAAPNTNSDASITLPAITGGEFIVSNASGNVGIGTASPLCPLSVGAGSLVDANVPVQINSTPSVDAYYGVNKNGGYGALYGYSTLGAAAIIKTVNAEPIIFYTGNTNERARIDGSGDLLVSTTVKPQFNRTTGVGFQVSAGETQIANDNNCLVLNRTNTSDGDVQKFFKRGAQVGQIVVTNTTTAYQTSSDYRLKHDIAPMTGALAKVQQLKPVTYKWNADDSAGEGFIAHELQEVCPSAVTGEKDAVDAEGNPRYQGIDTSFLVATLTAAIQELNAKVDAQAAEIAALKGQA